MGGGEDAEAGYLVGQVEVDGGLATGEHEDRVPEDGLREIGTDAAGGRPVRVGVLADDEGGQQVVEHRRRVLPEALLDARSAAAGETAPAAALRRLRAGRST